MGKMYATQPEAVSKPFERGKIVLITEVMLNGGRSQFAHSVLNCRQLSSNSTVEFSSPSVGLIFAQH